MKQLNDKSVKNDYLKKAKDIIYNKYCNNITKRYNLFKIHCILSNAKCHTVSLFKDFLLYDDISEFLKRFYNAYESFPRLKKISKFFKETSVLYPNYSPLIESKYIYSNIIKKQMVINKQENYKKKNYNKDHNLRRRHYHIKIEKENKYEKKFFNSTIYNDILNESESFMSLLFGVDNKDKNKNIEKINEKKINEEKDMDEVLKIINIIENNEDNKNNIDNNILENNIDDNNIYNKDNYKKESNMTITKKSKNIMDNFNIINNNLKNSISTRIMFNNRYRKNHRKIIRIEKQNFINSQNNIRNNNYDLIKEKNNNINSPDTKQNISSNNKIIYHRKVNSSLIGNYLNKLDLPSNSNVVNMLKLANETYAENSKGNNVRASLYKVIRNSKNRIKHSMKKTNNPQSLGKNIISVRNIKNSNSINSINNKTEIITSPEITKSKISGITKIENYSKKIEIPKRSKNNYFGIKKRGSPFTTRNFTSIIGFYENYHKKKNNNEKKSTNKINSVNNNISNGNLFNSSSNNMIIPNNSVFYTSKKPEVGFKSIYVNPNFTGPYSKPKCIYKDKKLKIISARKLFSKSNENINKVEEKNK